MVTVTVPAKMISPRSPNGLKSCPESGKQHHARRFASFQALFRFDHIDFFPDAKAASVTKTFRPDTPGKDRLNFFLLIP